MTISSNLSSFLSKPVTAYHPDAGIKNTENIVYRLNVAYNDSLTIHEKLDALAADPNAAALQELVIGQFDSDLGTASDELVDKLIALKDAFPGLKSIFIGDITFEECEISWIKQTDMTPLLNAFPALEHFQVRGGDGLRFSNLRHENLKTLIIETGGLYPGILTDVNNAELPRLEKLELWLGSDEYGFGSSVEDFAIILSGEKFPHLKHLGLMNSELQNELAEAVCKSNVLKQLDVLDLSMGTLSDEGGKVLLHTPDIKRLSFLNLRRHYLSEDMMQQLRGLGINVNLDEQQDTEDDFRYVEVSE